MDPSREQRPQTSQSPLHVLKSGKWHHDLGLAFTISWCESNRKCVECSEEQNLKLEKCWYLNNSPSAREESQKSNWIIIKLNLFSLKWLLIKRSWSSCFLGKNSSVEDTHWRQRDILFFVKFTVSRKPELIKFKIIFALLNWKQIKFKYFENEYKLKAFFR